MAERNNGTYKSESNGTIKNIPENYSALTQSEKIKLGIQNSANNGIRTGTPETWTESVAMNIVNGLNEWIMTDLQNIFYWEYLAKQNISKKTIDYLINKFESFSEMYDQVKQIQENKLLYLSLYDKDNRTNSRFGEFLLKAVHKYNDRSNPELDVPPAPIQINYNFTTNNVQSNPTPKNIIDSTPIQINLEAFDNLNKISDEKNLTEKESNENDEQNLTNDKSTE